MRIEITTGEITSVLPVFGFESLIDSGIDDVEKVMSGFKTVQNAISNVRGQDPKLVRAAEHIANRIERDTEKKERLNEFKNDYTALVENTVKTDQKVALIVEQNKEKFYQINPWLRPPQEKWYQRWYENAEKFLIGAVDKVIDQVAKVWKCAVEFYHKNQKLIHSIATALEAIAVIAFAFVTGGIALFPILVAVINLVSAGMEIWSTWNEDNPLANSVGFKAIKMGVDTLALVTKILVWPAAEGVKLSGLLGRLFPVMSGFDIAKDLTKSVFFFVVDGAILNMDRNANTSVDFVKDIDEINGVKDTAENLIQSFST